MPRAARGRYGRGARALGITLLVAGSVLLGEQVWLGAKAAVAEVLIDRAFERHLRDGRPHRPWGWADTWPKARLACPRLGISVPVLAGSAGPSLAFGLGHLDGTAAPNGAGNCVVAGHRDSWARFLRDLRRGDRIVLRSRRGATVYRVESLDVVHESEGWVAQNDGDRLTLLTCFPFRGLLGSPWRFVAVARPVAGSAGAGLDSRPAWGDLG